MPSPLSPFFPPNRFAAICISLLATLIGGCDQAPSSYQVVQARGELRVATRATHPNRDTTPVQLDQAVAREFAAWLGVDIAFIEVSAPAAADLLLREGAVDFVADGEPVDPRRKPTSRYGVAYRAVDEVILARRGKSGPTTLDLSDLAGKSIAIPAGSTLSPVVSTLGAQPTTTSGSDVPQLMHALAEGRTPLVAASSDYAASFRSAYPEVNVATRISVERPVAWRFPSAGDDSLRFAGIRFFTQIRQRKEIPRLFDRYMAHHQSFEYIAIRRLMRRIDTRLPRFESAFRRSAKKVGMDWRLLAAVGYQESHWNPRAVSPTGVRGIMMLTRPTARELGVNRKVPAQSIDGGARYLSSLRRRLGTTIPAVERDWFALAAYNLGLAHVRSARAITEQTGGDPNRWADVAKRLPLLRQSRWYSKLSTGRARGDVAVDYVVRVRRWYDVIRWHHPDTPARQ